MKVTLAIDLDIPDELVSDLPDPFLRELLFDEYINYAALAHIEDSMEWAIIANNDNGTYFDPKSIADRHKMWFNIARNSQWTFKRG